MAEETTDTLKTQVEEHEKSDQEFGDAFEAASKDEPSEKPGEEETKGKEEEEEIKAKEETKEETKEEQEEDEGKEAPPDLDFLSKEDRDALSEAEKHVPGLRKIVARTKSWDGRLRKSTGETVVLRQQLEETQGLLNEARSKAPREEKEVKEEKPAKVELSEEEQEALSELENEYPVLHKAVQTLLKKATTEIVTEHVQPIKDKEAKAAKDAKDQEDEDAREHFRAIAESHPDFLDVVNSGDLDAWIQDRAYSEAVELMEVRNGGNAKQVVELLDRYKEERATGKTSEADAAKKEKEDKEKAAKEAKAKEEADRKAKRDKDLAASQAVRHRSGGPPPGQADKDDFEGAFAEAVNQSR